MRLATSPGFPNLEKQQVHFSDLCGAVYTAKMNGSDEKVLLPDVGDLTGMTSCSLEQAVGVARGRMVYVKGELRANKLLCPERDLTSNTTLSNAEADLPYRHTFFLA